MALKLGMVVGLVFSPFVWDSEEGQVGFYPTHFFFLFDAVLYFILYCYLLLVLCSAFVIYGLLFCLEFVGTYYNLVLGII